MTEYDEPGKERIIALIDMDCFFVQVMVRQQPQLIGKPVIVLQYSDTIDGGSSALAVSYEARALGIKRGMFKKECIEVCPTAELLVMPHHRNKPDLSIFRSASSEVMSIFREHGTVFERASIDEAFLDITANVNKMIGLPIHKSKLYNTFIGGFEGSQEEQINSWQEHLKGCGHDSNDFKLTLGAVYVNMIRAQVLKDTKFTCSAGIGPNKIVAKLAAGTHKPDSQTIITPDNIVALYSKIKFTSIRNFGGKLGKQIEEDYGIEYASELIKFSQADLVSKFGDKMGMWIYYIARGHDSEPVKPRSLVKQTGCAKNFPHGIKHASELEKWVTELSEELEERLAFEKTDNKRIATQFVTSLRLKEGGGCSMQCALGSSTVDQIRTLGLDCINKKLPRIGDVYADVVYTLSLGAGRFVAAPEKSNLLTMLKSRRSRSSEEQNKSDNMNVDDPGPSTGFFDKYKTENVILPEPVVNKENNLQNPWNNLSEEDQRLMLGQDSDNSKVKCPVCNKSVLELKLPEHLDFHTALDLQRQFEKQFRESDSGVSPKRALPSGSKKKQSKKQKVSAVPCKNIASFFSKSPKS